jgi:glutamate-ammonia-ligase adenylyltransferase
MSEPAPNWSPASSQHGDNDFISVRADVPAGLFAVVQLLRDFAVDVPTECALERLLPYLRHALASAASTDRAVANLTRLIRTAPDPGRLICALSEAPHVLDTLVTLFAGSQFLSEILLRDLHYLPWLAQRSGVAQDKSPAQYGREARAASLPRLSESSSELALSHALEALRHYQHQELLHIGVCDLTGLLDLPSVTAQLSHLADSVIAVCLETLATSKRLPLQGLAVLAMGKLGGEELNYSSDVDLLFLAERDATTYQRLCERLIGALTEPTGEGFLYRVDMRLRPWGRVGPLISTVDGHLAYIGRHARLWEKQALLKARVVAGDHQVGDAFLAHLAPLLFGTDPDLVRADVHAMKQQTEAQLRRLGRDWGEVKLGEGSIRDVEFVVQYLQLIHGGQHAGLRTGNTLVALRRLAESGFLPPDEYRVLEDGYTFLRTVEHYLQILDYRQTYSLPKSDGDLRYLAQRLGFQGPDATARFVTQYQQHCAAVRAIYWRHLADHAAAATPRVPSGVGAMSKILSNGRSTYPETAVTAIPSQSGPDSGPDRVPDQGSPEAAQGEAARAPVPGGPPASMVARHLARLVPSYAATFSRDEIREHAAMAARLGDNNPVEVEATDLGAGYWRVTVVGYDYLGELSLICGLLFGNGFSIMDGHIYTYEPRTDDDLRQTAPPDDVRASRNSQQDARRKIVDVLTVRRPEGVQSRPEKASEASTDSDDETAMRDLWLRYASDLSALVSLLEARQQREAQGELAKRVASALHLLSDVTPVLHPIDIEIDNDTSDRYTILRIDTPDTTGFLYEFTNALALNSVHIAQVTVASRGNRVHDILYVTNTRVEKITLPERQRELRAATVLVKHFTHLLPRSPNPESALRHFHEYIGELFNRPSWPDELASLERPEVLDALARLLGVSDFLWDDFLRMQYANLFPVVQDVSALAGTKTRAQLAAELGAALRAAPDPATRRDQLNAFKDREMFRIDMRHILGYIGEIGQFSAELTDLVEVVIGSWKPSTARHWPETAASHAWPCVPWANVAGKSWGSRPISS